MRFVTSQPMPADQPIHATLEVDGDGDLTLLLNGERVLYIDHDTGALYRRYGPSTLGQMGVKTDETGKIEVAG